MYVTNRPNVHTCSKGTGHSWGSVCQVKVANKTVLGEPNFDPSFLTSFSHRTNSKGWTYRIGDGNRPDPTATGPRYQVVIAAGRELRDLRAKVAEMIWDVKPSRFCRFFLQICGTGPASWRIAPLDVRVEVRLGRTGLIHWLYLSNVWNAWTVSPQDLRFFEWMATESCDQYKPLCTATLVLYVVGTTGSLWPPLPVTTTTGRCCKVGSIPW